MINSGDERDTVVLANADQTTRTMMRAKLEEAGLTVVVAEDGQGACEAFREHKPALVLLAHDLPVLDGFAACVKIRRSPRGAAAPVLLLIADGDVDSVRRAYRAGATDYIASPIDWSVFAHRIRYVLRASRDYQRLRYIEIKNDVLLNALPDYVVVLDGDDTVTDFVPGQFKSPLPAHPDGPFRISDWLPDSIARAWGNARDSVGRSGKPVSMEFGLDDLAGRRSYYEARFTRSIDESIVATVSEITDRKRADQRIRRLAFYDNLTGLPNRQAFRHQVDGLLNDAREADSRVAVVCIDLDNFKRINDTLGHTIGDGVLKSVAERLSKSVRRRSDLGREDEIPTGVARLGGDEFAFAIHDFDDDGVLRSIAERVGDQLRKPVSHAGHEFVVTPSIGISVFPEDGECVEELLKNADVAMYQAKDAGRDSVRFYSGTMSIRSMHGLAMERDLRRALDSGAFELHYQPKLELESGKLVGAEALIRWQDEEGNFIPPDTFIPMAEESGLIIPIGNWVLREACRQANRWHQKYNGAPRVAVNISSRQFYQSDLQQTVMKALFEAGARPSLLQLELTESILMRDVDKTIAMLEYLKNTGITLAIDDFGTGYSSLSYLKRFPIDALKIDRSFVMDLEASDDSATICAAIIAMARELGLTVIAEGVETVLQADFLKEQECDQIQGYLFSKPVPAGEFEQRFLAGVDTRFALESGGRE